LIADTVRSHPRPGSNSLGAITHVLCAEGHDASEDGTGRGVPLVARALTKNGCLDGESETFVACDLQQATSPDHRGSPTPVAPSLSGQMRVCAFNARQDPDVSGEIAAQIGAKDTGHAIAWNLRGRDGGSLPEVGDVNLRASSGGSSRSYVGIRRLTPRECERLQGFPDDYTNIPGASDSARYRALGNSMAVTVMRWIGKRIS